MSRRLAALALALSAAWLPAAPAAASSIPVASLRGGQIAVTAGFADWSVDYAVLDRLQLGAGGAFTLMGAGTYGRATWRLLDETPLGDVGLHLAGGTFSGVLAKGPNGLFAFAGPVVSRRVTDLITIRASLGVIATDAHNVTYNQTQGPPQDSNITSRSWGFGVYENAFGGIWPLVPNGPLMPNLEVAFRLAPNHELTLLGNAIIGWRGVF